MGIEYELKFAATAQSLAKVRQDLGEGWEEIRMRTTYYDTPHGALSSRKWTLRRRLENGIGVCTLKTPAGLGRQEYEVVCDSIEEGIAELCKLNGPQELAQLTAGGVEAVCGAAFTRLAKRVEFPGFAAEVALDSGELFSGENRQPLCELEVELKGGDGEKMRQYALYLAAVYDLRPEHGSKFKRALALRR